MVEGGACDCSCKVGSYACVGVGVCAFVAETLILGLFSFSPKSTIHPIPNPISNPPLTHSCPLDSNVPALTLQPSYGRGELCPSERKTSPVLNLDLFTLLRDRRSTDTHHTIQRDSPQRYPSFLQTRMPSSLSA